MSERKPRFGLWAPYRGQWVVPPAGLADNPARWDFSKAVVQSADRVGFDSVLFAQHTINPGGQEREILEPWTASAAAAAVTKNIEIIAAIKPRLYHPVVLAKLALGIEDISEGRFALNVVNAWFIPELEKSGIGFPEHDERYAYGREWIQVVRDLIEGKTVNFEGKYFNVRDYNLKPASLYRDRPYIYAGGESETARDYAVDFADNWLINGRPLEDTKELVASVSGRSRQGRALDFGTTGFVATRATDAAAEEYLESLYDLQGIPDQLAAQIRLTKVDPKAQTIHYAKKYGETRRIGANGGVLPGFVGSYDRVARRFADFYEAGVTTFLLSFFPHIEEQELFASEIIPRVHALTGTKQLVVA
ncbi:MAG: LLM class flavin-dependent oxidoreductase [Rariglobus sp.]